MHCRVDRQMFASRRITSLQKISVRRNLLFRFEGAIPQR